jgi:GNAT superfamily N-acetyltransferase
MTLEPGATDEIEIRRIRADEWPQLRDLRLEALKDTPTAFVEVYDDSVARPDEFWVDRAVRGAGSDRQATFVAAAADRFVGMTVALLGDEPTVANIVGVYVSPQWRGRHRGVIAALFDAAVGWARGVAGVQRVQLFVTDGNERAAAFYRRYGFVPTGVTLPYPLDPSIAEIQLELPV